MSNPLEKFMHERGVRAPLPNRALETYPKYWERTVRWRAAANASYDIVRAHGNKGAIDILNTAVGTPAFFTDTQRIPQLGRMGTYGFIRLPGGCRWALEENGRCTFCELQTTVDEIVGDLPISKEEFSNLFRTGRVAVGDVDMLNVFTAGSFLNPAEIPMGNQETMAHSVVASTTTSILRVESRVQYIVEETLRPLVDILWVNGKTLDVAIGFETQDDRLRNKVLRKGMSREGFLRAVSTAKMVGARVSTYVMLMPVAMDEGYAIQECIESIRFAFSVGVDEVLLQARYSHNPNVRCPKLWSIARVLRETASLGPVMLGRWEGELPEPKVWPQNCPACTRHMLAILDRWRRDMDPIVFNDPILPICACRAEWEREAAKTDPPTASRVHLPIAVT